MLSTCCEAGQDPGDDGCTLKECKKEFSTRADVSWSLGLGDFVHWSADVAEREYKDREFIYDGWGDWDLATCDTCYENRSYPGGGGPSIWKDATTLMTGVYYNPYGNITMTEDRATGMVTLIGERVLVTADETRFTALSNGVVAYGYGTDDNAVYYGSDDPDELGTIWSGSLFAPNGGVYIGGKNFAVYGAVAAQRFTYDGQSQSLILY